MGEKTGIAWTHHTYNLGWGCTPKSAGCKNCYAARDSKRWGYDLFGAGKERRYMAEKYLCQPLNWNRKAEAAGERRRVFCGSMMDWTDPEWAHMLPGLWQMWANTPWLDWLMLTKNADKIEQCIPLDWRNGLPNVWLGVTVENQGCSFERIPILSQIPAAIRFISVEPMLSSVDLMLAEYPGIHWVIFGCESGPNRRWCDSAWIRDGVRQCRDAGVEAFVKQVSINGRVSHDPGEWDEDLRIQEFPK